MLASTDKYFRVSPFEFHNLRFFKNYIWIELHKTCHIPYCALTYHNGGGDVFHPPPCGFFWKSLTRVLGNFPSTQTFEKFLKSFKNTYRNLGNFPNAWVSGKFPKYQLISKSHIEFVGRLWVRTLIELISSNFDNIVFKLYLIKKIF